jgi:hypothetical protein
MKQTDWPLAGRPIFITVWFYFITSLIVAAQVSIISPPSGTVYSNAQIVANPAAQSLQTSSVVSLTVKIPDSLPPVIVVQPRDKKALTGRIANFDVIANGAPPLAYQWFFNGTALPGATAARLKLIRLSANMAGDYSVTISNAYGAVSSSPAKLILLKPTLPSLPPPSGLRIVQ